GTLRTGPAQRRSGIQEAAAVTGSGCRRLRHSRRDRGTRQSLVLPGALHKVRGSTVAQSARRPARGWRRDGRNRLAETQESPDDDPPRYVRLRLSLRSANGRSAARVGKVAVPSRTRVTWAMRDASRIESRVTFYGITSLSLSLLPARRKTRASSRRGCN